MVGRKRQRVSSPVRARQRERDPSPEAEATSPSAAQRQESVPQVVIHAEEEAEFQARDVFGTGQQQQQHQQLAAVPPRGGGGGPPGFGFPLPEEEIVPEVVDPKLSLESVGGLEEQVSYLRRRIIAPLTSGINGFAGIVIEPVKGVVFHGPPGTGKTLLAKSFASELSRIGGKRVNFFMRKGTDVYSKWIGESEKTLRNLFAKAAELQPSVIFFDELDGLCPVRKEDSHHHTISVVTSFLGLVDNVKPGEVFIIGATNRLDALDPAILRPGRFDKHILFSPPNQAGRLSILNIKLQKWGAYKPSQAEVEEMARGSVGFTGADLEKLIQTAVDCALERQFPAFGKTSNTCPDLSGLRVLKQDWIKALGSMTKSNSSVFGSSFFSGEVMSESLRPLLQGIVREVMEKINPFLAQGNAGQGIKSLLAWAPTEPALSTLDTVIIPAVLGACDTKEHPAFLISLHQPTHIPWVLHRALCSAQEKPSIVVIPRIDLLWIWLQKNNTLEPFLQNLKESRGKNLTILATALCQSQNLPENLQPIFHGINRNLQVRKPTEDERQSFFEPFYNPKAAFHNLNRGNLKDQLKRVVCLTKEGEISNMLTLHGELNTAAQAFLTKSIPSHDAMMKAFDDILTAYETNKLNGSVPPPPATGGK